MAHLQISESLYERISRLREELLEVPGDVQLIIEKTRAYMITEGCVINLEPASVVAPQEKDVLLPYALDMVAAPEEVHDLTETVSSHDTGGLLVIATDPANPNGQRLNAYRKLGEYIQISQESRTATSIKRELQEHSHQNGSRIYQIAQRTRTLASEVGMLRPKSLQLVTPDWLCKLPKQEYERMTKMCGEMHLQLMNDLWGMGLGSQELPLEGGNV
jgi:hypothetical protein